MSSANLTTTQQTSLSQLRDLLGTDSFDEEVSISILESVGWDVTRAVDVMFGGDGAPPAVGASSSSASASVQYDAEEPEEDEEGNPMLPTAGRTTRIEQFDIDETDVSTTRGLAPSSRRAASSSSNANNVSSTFLTILTYPLTVLSSLVRFIFTILRIPFPRPFLSLNFLRGWNGGQRPRPTYGPGGGSIRSKARQAAERWIRELEDETGARCPSLSGPRSPVAGPSARATGIEAGIEMSNLTSRGVGGSSGDRDGEEDGERRMLPEFLAIPYEEFLRRCEREMKVGCVILVSEEHDDVGEFKRFVFH
jgi:FAS-associated factor 2